MKQAYTKILALILIVILILPLCACKKKVDVENSFTAAESSESKAEESSTKSSGKKPKMDTEKVTSSESKATESKATESKATESKASESKATESKAAEKAATLKIITQPVDFQMTKSQCTVNYTVSVSGGKADYTYTWYEKVDTNVSVVKQETNSNTTSSYSTMFKNDNFTGVGSITFYCEVTDASGQKITSSSAAVKPYIALAIASNPAEYQMMSSSEVAKFTVTVKGGVAPYTYQWYSVWDGNKKTGLNQELDEKTSSYSFPVNELQFDTCDEIGAYCVITDAAGKKVTSSTALINPYTMTIVYDLTSDYVVEEFPDTIPFTVSVKGGVGPYTYTWYTVMDNFQNCEKTVTTTSRSCDLDLVVNESDFVGPYDMIVFCVIEDSAGHSVQSRTATISR